MGKEKAKSGYVVLSRFNDISDFGKVWHEGDDVSHFDDARLDSLVGRNLVESPNAKEDAKAKAAAEKEAAEKAKADVKALKEQEEAEAKAKADAEKAEAESKAAAEKEATDKAKPAK